MLAMYVKSDEVAGPLCDRLHRIASLTGPGSAHAARMHAGRPLVRVPRDDTRSGPVRACPRAKLV